MSDFITGLNYLGFLIVLTSFLLKNILYQRLLTIIGSVLIIIAALFDNSYLILVLGLFLLVINVYKLYRRQILLKDLARKSDKDEHPLNWLTRFMKREKFSKGAILFKDGDKASRLYYISEGELGIDKSDKIYRRGDVIGEVTLFSLEQKRVTTVRCLSDIIAYSIDRQTLFDIFSQDAKLGFKIIELLTEKDLRKLSGNNRPKSKNDKPKEKKVSKNKDKKGIKKEDLDNKPIGKDISESEAPSKTDEADHVKNDKKRQNNSTESHKQKREVPTPLIKKEKNKNQQEETPSNNHPQEDSSIEDNPKKNDINSDEAKLKDFSIYMKNDHVSESKKDEQKEKGDKYKKESFKDFENKKSVASKVESSRDNQSGENKE